MISAGPRFFLVFFQYYLHRSDTSILPIIVLLSGVVRTLLCGGWVYVTSTDNHDVHDIMMILYIISNVPWMLVGTATTPLARLQVRKRRFVVVFSPAPKVLIFSQEVCGYLVSLPSNCLYSVQRIIRQFLRYSHTFGIFFHPTQSPPNSWRYAPESYIPSNVNIHHSQRTLGTHFSSGGSSS